jgi:N-acetylneuraminic acid mutarotase
MSFTQINFEFNLKSKPNQDNKLKPFVRMGHVSCSYGRFIILWGGLNRNNNQEENGENVDLQEQQQNLIEQNSLIWVFDTDIEKWYSIAYEQDDAAPPILSGAFPVIHDDHLYLFGGSFRTYFRGFPDTYSNKLYKFNLKALKWETIEPKSKLPSPRDKISGWKDENGLFFWGGFGSSFDGFLHENGQFVEISNFLNLNRRLGWNNQLLYYNVKNETWHDVALTNAPHARAAHTCTKMNDSQVVIFGGRTLESRTNDLFLVNLNDFSCSKNLNEDKKSTDLPTNRSWHTMVKLNDYNVFLYGGLSQANQSLGDGWILNTLTFNWTKVKVPFETRLWHTAVCCSDTTQQIYIFGGSSTDIYINQPQLPEHTLKISLTPETLKRSCLHFISSNVALFEEKIISQFPEIPVVLEKLISLKASREFNKKERVYNSQTISKHQQEFCTVF